MKFKIAQVFGLLPNHFLDSEFDGTIEKRIENTIANEPVRDKDVIEDIENIISSTCQEMDEKNLKFLKRFKEFWIL